MSERPSISVTEARSPREHLDRVIQHLRSFGARPRSESIPVGPDALGRVLAEDMLAPLDSPRFDNSQMDGFALAASDVEREDRVFLVGPVVAAGSDPEQVYPNGLEQGTVCPIMTGAKIPDGVGAVVPVERCEPPEFVETGRRVSVPKAPSGQFIRTSGSDIMRGERVLRRGQAVMPHRLGILAGMGCQEVVVRAQPRVLICTGGEEVLGMDSTAESLGAAGVFDANAPMLSALCVEYGLDVVGRVHTSDRPEDGASRLREAVRRYRPDVIITSGGISHGAFEVIRQIIGSSATSWFGHVSQQPGGPQGYGDCEGVPVICLPGNPVSTLVSFRVVIATAAAAVWGTRQPQSVQAVLETPVHGVEGKTQFRRGRLVNEGSARRVAVVGGAGSHLLSQMAEADCLLEVPAHAQLSAGDVVTAHLLNLGC
ncbi:gephyrin-like molybdotransferase Glp [uncultured Kocuria sp.]|uniref:molybdopterin molybdotransferase MoeA n=1 Tax=uncultured Kocuria sp. TaxID=259305 RepID=UPI0025943326|nr:gephyrin-like molybdotransferase Glp [uncultured Kocuria sp.]MCT1367341.1 molybdopterin molybdotransferase MoeA [Rothia sp. p3-SID1597]